jgi:hypothetical protein
VADELSKHIRAHLLVTTCVRMGVCVLVSPGGCVLVSPGVCVLVSPCVCVLVSPCVSVCGVVCHKANKARCMLCVVDVWRTTLVSYP